VQAAIVAQRYIETFSPSSSKKETIQGILKIESFPEAINCD
jgi:hypothetical protein